MFYKLFKTTDHTRITHLTSLDELTTSAFIKMKYYKNIFMETIIYPIVWDSSAL